MFRYTCLNPIAQVGLNGFDDTYEKTEALADADAVLVRIRELSYSIRRGQMQMA